MKAAALQKSLIMGIAGSTALILAGCGAGTEDSTTSTRKVSIPITPTAISVSNRNTVVTEAADSIDGAVIVGELPVSIKTQDNNAPAFSIFDFAGNRLLDYARQGLKQQTMPTAISASIPLTCDAGSASMTFNVQQLNIKNLSATILIANDSFTVKFSNCLDNADGTTLNGSMGATLVSGTLVNGCADTAQGCGDVTLNMRFNDLQVSEMNASALFDGGFNMAHNSSANSNTVSGSDFYIYSDPEQGLHLSNFTIVSTQNTTNKSTSVDMTLASTRINGSVNVQTTSDLITLTGDDRPSSGVLVITGVNSTLTVIPQSPNSVQLNLNDGLTNPTETVSWAAIK